MDARKIVLLICAVSLMFAIAGCGSEDTGEPTATATVPEAPAKLPYEGKKILFVEAYHQGYAWSDGIVQGVNDKVAGTGIDLRTIRMDTKRNTDIEGYIKPKALEIKNEIDTWKPDVVLISDDNPFKFILMPYYKNSNVPFVYSGINWESKKYGTPYTNAIGMVEVALTPQLLDRVKTYAKGTRLGYISGDTETERTTMKFYKESFGLTFEKEYWLKDVAEFKTAWVALNNGEVDYILLENIAGMNGWEDTADVEMRDFIIANTKVPTATTYDFVAPMTLISIAKIPNEHGEYMVETAKKILDGTPPSTMSEESSRQGQLFINMNIADQLGVIFSPDLLKSATQI